MMMCYQVVKKFVDMISYFIRAYEVMNVTSG